MWVLTEPRRLYEGPLQTSGTASASGSKGKKASIVILLHLRPVCDPVLFPRVLGPNTQIELIALSPANFHPLVLWHYPVVDGPPEESELWGRGENGAGERDGDVREMKEGARGWIACQGGESGFHSWEAELKKKKTAQRTLEGGQQKVETRDTWKSAAEQAAWREGRSRADKRGQSRVQQKTRIAPQAQSFSLQRRIPIWFPQGFFCCFFLPRSPTGVCCRGTRGVLSSRRSASLFQRAGSSSQPSGPWPHTSPSCWPSGRSHTGGGGCEVRPPAPHQRYRSVKSLSAD